MKNVVQAILKLKSQVSKSDDASEMLKKEEAAASGAQGSASGCRSSSCNWPQHLQLLPQLQLQLLPQRPQDHQNKFLMKVHQLKFNKSVLSESLLHGRTICERAPTLTTELVTYSKGSVVLQKIISLKGIKIFTI